MPQPTDQATFMKRLNAMFQVQEDMLGLDMYGGEPDSVASAKIVTATYRIDHSKRNMPDPCKSRNQRDQKAHAKDIGILYDTLSNKSCGCSLHDKGCFDVAHRLGFQAPHLIAERRVDSRYSGESWRKTQATSLEESIHGLTDLQHKLILRYPPNHHGLPVCRDAWLHLTHVPLSTFTESLRKINNPVSTALVTQHKLLAQRLAKTERGPVAQNQFNWLRAQIKDVAQNPPNRTIAKSLVLYIPVLATLDDPDEGRKGRKMRKPPVQL
jgi:hypothetical protein